MQLLLCGLLQTMTAASVCNRASAGHAAAALLRGQCHSCVGTTQDQLLHCGMQASGGIATWLVEGWGSCCALVGLRPVSSQHKMWTRTLSLGRL